MLIDKIFSVDPYRMVFVNISALLMVLLLLFINRILLKKQLSWFSLLLLFSILPIVSIFRQGTYESGDLSINAVKLMSFYDSLEDGILIPRWSENLNATYGYPNFIFAYPLPYYLGSFFHWLGFGFIESIKMVLIVSYIFSGLAIFLCLKELFTEKAAFLGGILYLFAPYHLVDLHFRVAIGEILAMAWLPFSLLFMYQFLTKKHFSSGYLAALSLAFLVLSHQAMSLLGIPLVFLLSLFWSRPQSIKDLIRLISPFVLGFAFSAYYWLPVIVESRYTHQAFYVQEVLFPSFASTLFSPWRMGLLFQGPYGELSFIVGYAHWLIVILSIGLLIFNKSNTKQRRFILFLLAMFFIYYLLMLRVSLPIWERLTILKNMQFSYRILGVICLITSGLGAAVVSILKKKWIFYGLVTLAIGSTILNWGNRRSIPEINDDVLKSSLPLSTYRGEGLHPATPIWTNPKDPWQKEVPKGHIEALSGEISVLSESRNSVRHTYVLDVKNNGAYIKENTYYFPGWKLFVNDRPNLINFQNIDYPGIITFPIKEGLHKVDLRFTDTPVRHYSLILSTISLLIISSFMVIGPFVARKRASDCQNPRV